MWGILWATAALADPAPQERIRIVMADDNAIIEMIKSVLVEELPKLRGCYEARQLQDPLLHGSWLLEFSVTTEGSVGSAAVTFREPEKPTPGAHDDEILRACMLAQMKGWPFQPIVADQPVRKTVTFEPSADRQRLSR